MEISERTKSIAESLIKNKGNVSAVSREMDITRRTVLRHREAAQAAGVDVPDPPWHPNMGQKKLDSYAHQARIKDAVDIGILPADMPGRVSTQEVEYREPAANGTTRYLITSAVNNTRVHEGFWKNLTALAEHYSAEIMVRRIAYNLGFWRKYANQTEVDSDEKPVDIWYDERVLPFVVERRVQLAPDLQYAGDAPVTATAASPLQGYDTFTAENSAIFGATKVEMRSIATMRGQHAKILYSTGAVTQRNYSETKTGQKADWHHIYGAALVEVDPDGEWFVRPLIAEDDGTINDLCVEVRDGVVYAGVENVAALTPGDIHIAEMEPELAEMLHEMVDELDPQEIHLHDLHDHKSRSHHDRRDPFRRFELMHESEECVVDEVKKAAEFINSLNYHHPSMGVVVVASNHDDHLRRWLCESDWRNDPVNARFYLQAADAVLEATEGGDKGFLPLEWACRRTGLLDDRTIFLCPDQSYKVVDVECGLHGDKGPNGSRGSIRNLAKIGAKVNIGHSHSAGIFDGAFQAGLMGGTPDVTLDYARGPSSWTRSFIVTFKNGKRTMITARGLKWRG